MSKVRAPSITVFRSAYMPGWPETRQWRVTGEDLIDGVELQSRDRADHTVLVHRATAPGRQRWQATWFDARGPGGDITAPTLERALKEGASPYEYDVTTIHLVADRGRTNPGALMARSNPTNPTKAIAMFRRFHTRDWRGVGEFAPGLEIPADLLELGDAVNVLYSSDKLNPTDGTDEGWIDYIHEHGAGVKVYQPAHRRGGAAGGRVVAAPAWLRNVTQVAWLGMCLGFSYKDERGKTCEAKGTNPLPELFAIPSGKALLVIQGKRTLLAVICGGRLNVERRGIVH